MIHTVENQSTFTEICPSVKLSKTNPTWTDMESILCLRG